MTGKIQRKTRPYSPVQGPQQRRRLLKELGRKDPRKKFSVSPSDVRRNVGKIFGFTPLTPVSGTQLSLLKQKTRLSVSRRFGRYYKTAKALISGNTRLATTTTNLAHTFVKPHVSTIRRFFTDEEIYRRKLEETEFHVSTKDTVGHTPEKNGIHVITVGRFGDGSRDLRDYKSEGGIDVLGLAKKAYARKGSTIQFLDVGSATARAVSQLKKRMGEKVETHALTPIDEPRAKGVDVYHQVVAEYLPASFRGRFDLIVSHRALEYALFPDLALRNISQALALGGQAELQWRGGRVDFRKELLKPTERFFKTYKNAGISAGAIQLVKESARLDEKVLTTAEAKQRVKSGIKYDGIGARITLSWYNEIARLIKSPNFDVKILNWTLADFGWAPGKLLITRKK